MHLFRERSACSLMCGLFEKYDSRIYTKLYASKGGKSRYNILVIPLVNMATTP